MLPQNQLINRASQNGCLVQQSPNSGSLRRMTLSQLQNKTVMASLLLLPYMLIILNFLEANHGNTTGITTPMGKTISTKNTKKCKNHYLHLTFIYLRTVIHAQGINLQDLFSIISALHSASCTNEPNKETQKWWYQTV